MSYPKVPNYGQILEQLRMFAQQRHEYGAKGISLVLREAERALGHALARMRTLPVDRARAAREPNDLAAIRRLRPAGPRRLWNAIDPKVYAERLEGAWLARLAGCTLGAMVEGWQPADMEAWAKQCGDAFPPRDYWRRAKTPDALRYNLSRFKEYERDRMNGVPVDDDIIYTILGLHTVEQYGPRFTTEDAFKVYVKYLPTAWLDCWNPIESYKRGVPADKAADAGRHPYCELIGADIRADGYAYMAPGWPERAAEMAYRDAFMTHRRNGVYGAMFLAAATSAAFAVDDPVRALRIGLTEIPRSCALAQAIRWALRTGKAVGDYRAARRAVDRRFAGMHPVHTINNACLATFGLMIGRRDVTRVIGETVAMGMDNDCTAATAGSIAGAVVGAKNVPRHWTRNFNNTVHSYLTGKRHFKIDDLLRRFAKQAQIVYEQEK